MTLELEVSALSPPNQKSKLIICCWAGGGVVGRRLLHGGKSGQRVCCKVGVGGSGPRPAYFIRPDRISLEAAHPANITYKLQVYPTGQPPPIYPQWGRQQEFRPVLKNSNLLSMTPSYPGSFQLFEIIFSFFHLLSSSLLARRIERPFKEWQPLSLTDHLKVF